jgi:hypothetical protein
VLTCTAQALASLPDRRLTVKVWKRSDKPTITSVPSQVSEFSMLGLTCCHGLGRITAAQPKTGMAMKERVAAPKPSGRVGHRLRARPVETR